MLRSIYNIGKSAAKDRMECNRSPSTQFQNKANDSIMNFKHAFRLYLEYTNEHKEGCDQGVMCMVVSLADQMVDGKAMAQAITLLEEVSTIHNNLPCNK
jgi:hypothetical protein